MPQLAVVQIVETATQWIAVEVERTAPPGQTGDRTVRLSGDDGQGQTRTASVLLGPRGKAVVRVGPWRQGLTVALAVDLLTAGGAVEEGIARTHVVAGTMHPAPVVRQAVMDVLAAASLGGAHLVRDKWGRPETLWKDMPVSAGTICEVGPGTTRANRVTRVRSEVLVTLAVRAVALGRSVSEGAVVTDKLLWDVQLAVNAARNLGLSGLAVTDFSWRWTVSDADTEDTGGGGTPRVEQVAVLEVPVVWAG